MTPEQAAEDFWATLDEVEVGKSAVRRHERAATIIKRHMARNNLTTFKGIERVVEDGGRRVDLKLLESKDPDLVEACRYDADKTSLVPRRRPARRKPKAEAAA